MESTPNPKSLGFGLDLDRTPADGVGAFLGRGMNRLSKAPLRYGVRRAALLAGCCALASACGAGAARGASDQSGVEYFETFVRPVLAESCLECHGPKKQESGLRLDRSDWARLGGERGPAVVPGDLDRSQLIAAVRREGGLEMPPDEPLEDAKVEALARWIQMGAPWPETDAPKEEELAQRAKRHWAFQPIRDPSPPTAREDGWSETPIDSFILARLESEGLGPSEAADRRTLLRRLCFDLTGLPPSYDEAASFAREEAPDAYERVVDRLLASPRYGEQWARHWLDVARYSDTKGYVYAREERFWVHAWAYRDWVAASLNRDAPYDRFVLLQLAADQVAGEDRSDLAAMGFLTLGRRFLGVAHDILDDRIDVVTRGMLGLTVSCARCHDHKYDPIPTKDYYALYGVFRNCSERLTPLASAGEADALFAKGLREREAKLAEGMARRRAEAADRARAKIAEYLLAQTEMHKYPEEGFDQVLQEDDVIPATVRRWREHLARPERARDPVFAAWAAYAALDGEHFADRAASIEPPAGGNDGLKWNRMVAEAFEHPPLDMRDVAARYGQVFADVDRRWRAALDKVREDGGEPPRALDDPDAEAVRQAMYGPDSPCEPPDEPIVGIEFFVPTSVTDELWKLQGEVDRWLIRSPDAPPYAVILQDRPNPADARVFRRGNPANVGEPAPRRFLQVLAGADAEPFRRGSGRLELAQAIVDPANPLTARVIVNRVWQHHFGAGLVRTPSDFGTRSEPPSHPELLDWLAARFMEEGWRLKRLHREIVASAAFRQSSVGPRDAALAARAATADPENRLLWRANVRRLRFEELRDAFLAAAGVLDDAVGGKPVELFTAPPARRRSFYGLVDREFFPSVLRVFDVANPDLHIPRRTETLVPQQALFFLNHDAMMEWSIRLVENLDTADTSLRERRIEELYRRLFQRKPTADEMEFACEWIESAAAEPPATVRETTFDWQYGYGSFDPASGVLASFEPLPHFTGRAWQGGADWPDERLGWVRWTAEGGHAGNDLEHAAVRRWTAPRDGRVRVRSTVVHPHKAGDGVRASLVHRGAGLIQSVRVHDSRAEVDADWIEIRAGDTLDFVVDLADNLNSDDFAWTVAIFEEGEGAPSKTWESHADFPRDAESRLNAWQQLAQVLLLANEFVFVD